MRETKYITIISNRRTVMLSIGTILYILMVGKIAEIHVSGGKTYKTRMTLSQLEKNLGEGFIKVHRGCIVSVMAIHDVTDSINLSNGESLVYTLRKRNEILDQLHSMQKRLVRNLSEDSVPATEEEYRKHYYSFEYLPFAFADIEMIFNEESHAIDWIFRYGNAALAKLEKIPLKKLIGSSFGSLFSNMDSKWLRGYERATLYGEILEIMDYSPEIDAHLKVICFPTFKGHCGCILFDISEIKYAKNSNDAERTLDLYFGGLPGYNDSDNQ